MNTPKKYFKNDYTEMWIEDGILYSKYASNLKVTLEMAKINVQERLNLSEGKSYPMLVYGANLTQLDNEAGKYLGTEEALVGIKAGAFLAATQFDYLIIRLFMVILTPKVPTKLFLNEQRAMIWLNKYKEVNY